MADRPDREQVVKTFGKEAADFIEVAASLGWKVLFNNTGTSISLIPYDDGPKRIHLSSRNKGGGLYRKYSKVLAKYAEPSHAERVMQLAGSDIPVDMKREVNLMLGRLTLNEEDGAVQVMGPEKPKERFVPTPAAVAERVKEARHIISERPAMMHRRPGTDSRPGKSYPSKTTVERRWSDGAIDYACAVPTCGETSENRLAFRGPHWAMHVRKGEAEPVDNGSTQVVDDPTYTESAYTRKQSLHDKRRKELADLLKGINLAEISEEDLADQIMAFIESQMGGGGSGPVEALTPEQIIDRIRTLVDTGTYSEQEKAILERDQQIEELMAYAEKREEELEQRALESEQRATVAEAHLQALRDLINESVGGDINAG